MPRLAAAHASHHTSKVLTGAARPGWYRLIKSGYCLLARRELAVGLLSGCEAVQPPPPTPQPGPHRTCLTAAPAESRQARPGTWQASPSLRAMCNSMSVLIRVATFPQNSLPAPHRHQQHYGRRKRGEDGGRVPRSRKISGGLPPRNDDISVPFFLTHTKILHFPPFSK